MSSVTKQTIKRKEVLPILDNCKDILDVKDVCNILHINRKTLYILLKTGEISCRRIGRIYKIPKDSIINYMNHD